MTERELLIDCLERLNRSGVLYMLTGSMSSNYWGIPRTTHDLDFVIQFPPEKTADFIRAFQGDFYIEEEAVRTSGQPPFQFNAIDTRSAFKVDFWRLRSDPFEQEMFARRVEVRLFGLSAWIATAEDTLLHKLVWHHRTPSERQLGDAAGIVAVRAQSLDLLYLSTWARALGLSETLEELLSGRIHPKLT